MSLYFRNLTKNRNCIEYNDSEGVRVKLLKCDIVGGIKAGKLQKLFIKYNKIQAIYYRSKGPTLVVSIDNNINVERYIINKGSEYRIYDGYVLFIRYNRDNIVWKLFPDRSKKFISLNGHNIKFGSNLIYLIKENWYTPDLYSIELYNHYGLLVHESYIKLKTYPIDFIVIYDYIVINNNIVYNSDIKYVGNSVPIIIKRHIMKKIQNAQYYHIRRLF